MSASDTLFHLTRVIVDANAQLQGNDNHQLHTAFQLHTLPPHCALTRHQNTSELRFFNAPRGEISERVWHAAPRLARYLELRFGKVDAETDQGSSCRRLRHVVELGSGTGYCGAVLAALGIAERVVLTDLSEALDLLLANVRHNFKEGEGFQLDLERDDAEEDHVTARSREDDEHNVTARSGEDDADFVVRNSVKENSVEDDQKPIFKESSSGSSKTEQPHFESSTNKAMTCITVRRLRWGNNRDADAVIREGGEIDLILCSDLVYFVFLFEPLLQALLQLSSENTEILFGYRLRMMKEEAFWSQLGRYFEFHEIGAEYGLVRDRNSNVPGSDIYLFSARRRKVPLDHESDDFWIMQLGQIDVGN